MSSKYLQAVGALQFKYNLFLVTPLMMTYASFVFRPTDAYGIINIYTKAFDEVMGTFHWAVLSLCTRWRQQFPVQENPRVQRLTLSPMAQENAPQTKTTNKIHNFTEYSTSSDLILLRRSMLGYWEAFVTTPCPSHH